MPLVLPRSSRPEDAHLKRMRNEVSARHRSQRLTYGSKGAADIEYKQKAYYERSIKQPLLPQPKSDPGWSSPEWDVPRACWLSYANDDTSKWVCWDPFSERWIDISDYDKACSSPDSDLSKSERVSPSSTDLAERSTSPASNKPRFTLRAVAQSIMKVLALRGSNTEPDDTV